MNFMYLHSKHVDSYTNIIEFQKMFNFPLNIIFTDFRPIQSENWFLINIKIYTNWLYILHSYHNHMAQIKTKPQTMQNLFLNQGTKWGLGTKRIEEFTEYRWLIQHDGE